MNKSELLFLTIITVFSGLSLFNLFSVYELNNQVINLVNNDAKVVNEVTIKSTENIEDASYSGLLNKLDSFEDKIISLEKEIKTVKDSAVTKNSSENNTTVITQPAKFQKQIVHLGASETRSKDWVNTAQEITIDSVDYPKDINVSFEAGLSIVGGGQVWVRLVNKTTGAILASTELTHDTSTSTWKKSSSFKLHNGSNMYVVQIKSTSGETGSMSGARLIFEK